MATATCSTKPRVADGLSERAIALEAMARSGIHMKYERTRKVLGEGDFVLVASEGWFANNHVAFYDLFRVQYDRIVEHWDVIETIPERSDWKNTNGNF